MHVVKKFSVNEVEDAVISFKENGYVVFKNAFAVDEGDAFWDAVEHALDSGAPLTFSFYGKIYKNPDVPLEGFKIPRITDVEKHVASAPSLMLNPAVRAFLRSYYEGVEPTCLQTLTYKYSSEQAAHSDKTLVSPPYAHSYDRETLTASWFALEKADERNGALVIYPGSHRVEKQGIAVFGDDYGAYSQHCIDVSTAAGCPTVSFEADAGDLLFWHGDFVHAGGRIQDQASQPTRRSLVCHYALIPEEAASESPEWQRVPFDGASYFVSVE